MFLAVEVLTRVQWQSGWTYAVARYAGVGLVAAVAAVMSYRHMAALLARYGEDPFGAHLGPLGVDGLMVVSGWALLSEAARRGAADAAPAGAGGAGDGGLVPPVPQRAVSDGSARRAAADAVSAGAGHAADGGLVPPVPQRLVSDGPAQRANR